MYLVICIQYYVFSNMYSVICKCSCLIVTQTSGPNNLIGHGSIASLQAHLDLKEEYRQVFTVAKGSATQIRPKVAKSKSKAKAKEPAGGVLDAPASPPVPKEASPSQA